MLRRGTLTLALLTIALLPGCAADHEDDDDYTDATWSDMTTTSSARAVIDDASAVEDTTDPPADLDTTDDVAEAETDDPDAEADAPDVADADVTPADSAAPRPTFQNAVLGNCADPGVINTGNGFVVACTGGGYPTFDSPDLVHWKSSGHLFSTTTRPKWASKNFWAPEIHHIGSGFVAYFAAYSPSHGQMCIGAARAPTANGPFTDLGRPLVCQKGVGLIDVNLMTTADNRHFLYYKTDANALRPQQKTIIYGHELGANGISFVGQRHRLLANTLAWEGDVVEAPWVVKHGGYYEMFYSGYRYCNGTYGVGVARSRSPLGPFRKKGAPILHSNAGWSGPGHNSVVGVNGHDWIVYHAWQNAHECGQPGDRRLLIDRIAWSKGWPSVNAGTPSRGRHTAP